MTHLDDETLQRNFDKYRIFFTGLGARSEACLTMIDALGERLATCPASSKVSYHNAFPGGLIDHSLRVLSTASKLCKTFNYNLPKESLVIACLFHDIGKVGDDVDDFYLPQDSQWHREKLGEVYKRNVDLKLTTTDRSLWLCQFYGIRLTQDEWLAIRLADGQYVDENKPYKMKEPLLADVVHMADVIATKQEKASDSHT